MKANPWPSRLIISLAFSFCMQALFAAPGSGNTQDNPASSPLPPKLEELRSGIIAAKNKPNFAAFISNSIGQAMPGDAIALVIEFAPSIQEPKSKKALLVKAATLALLLGRHAQAAQLFEEAAFVDISLRDEALLLKAARLRIAAGEGEKALGIAQGVLSEAQDPQIARSARLAIAWLHIFSGDSEQAGRLADIILGERQVDPGPLSPKAMPAPQGSADRREALFLKWIASDRENRPAIAAILVKEYAGSPESLIAAGTSSKPALELFPLPHWYLSGVLREIAIQNPKPANPDSGIGPSQSALQEAKPLNSETVLPKTIRYQVGVFSLQENAARLFAELEAKGFIARTEIRESNGRKLIVVVVEGFKGGGGLDPEAILLRLKDSGYEAYPLF